MERDNSTEPQEQKPNPSADLCRLLTEQIAWARKGNFGQVERLATQTDSIVATMTRDGATGVDDAQRSQWERLYDELLVILRTEKVDVQDELKQLRQVRRAVGAYGGKKTPQGKARRSLAAVRS